jgi:hypothetical protein
MIPLTFARGGKLEVHPTVGGSAEPKVPAACRRSVDWAAELPRISGQDPAGQL